MELSSWCSGSEDASLLLSLAWASTSIYVNSLNIRALIKNVYNSVRNNSKKFNDYTALKLRASDELREAEPGFTMNIKQCLLHSVSFSSVYPSPVTQEGALLTSLISLLLYRWGTPKTYEFPLLFVKRKNPKLVRRGKHGEKMKRKLCGEKRRG